jgi:hypothetical protein
VLLGAYYAEVVSHGMTEYEWFAIMALTLDASLAELASFKRD